ncbi:MAG TPA: DUF3857 domain-containing transglutaminase family protein [Chryseolinea sp.]|nr:DUF3857 domain-containing transglutaminase family protein [Chryseolinea sp.]
MKRALFILIFCVSCLCAIGADVKYPVSGIPEILKKDVNAVVREDELTYKIVSQRNAIQTGHYAITIFNASANDQAEWQLNYDKLIKVRELRAAVYDVNGKLIKKVKSSDFRDASAFDGLYSDNRAKYIDLTQSTFPYTVEFDYELEYKFLFIIPTMTFVPDEKVSVQYAQFSLIYADGLKPRYYTQNVQQAPTEGTTSDGLHQISWALKDIMPIAIEPYGIGFYQRVPRIMAAPTKFEFEGYVGTMDTWQGYGQWIASLNRDRQNLPEATKAKVREIASKHRTREEKVRALYTYLQNRTRYVSIQLGIGGFQPFDATVVDQNGYGDCKALSNYMQALLNAVEIKSYYVLIMAGRNVAQLITDFPSSQFNHAVVAVPNGADTLWLECTSQTNPFGYSGNFTGNRKALLITDDGAQVVQTARYNERTNTQVTTAAVVLQPNGNATASVTTKYHGLQYENEGLNFHLDNQYDEQKKWIQNNTDIPTFDIKAFSMSDHKDRIPTADVKLDLVLNRYASVSGKRLFMTPNLMNRSTYIPERMTDRKSMVITRTAYTDIDTIQYSLPENIYPEFIPEPIVHKSRFGEYESSVKLEAGRLLYIRKIVMHRGEFPAETYSELVDFMKNLNRADNMKMVFLNKT